MLQYTVSGGPESSALVLITIDSPQVVLVMDPLFALVDFAVSPFKNRPQPSDEQIGPATTEDRTIESGPTAPPPSNGSALAYRIEIAHSDVMVVSSDTEANAQAIQLSIRDVVLAQQVGSDEAIDRPDLS